MLRPVDDEFLKRFAAILDPPSRQILPHRVVEYRNMFAEADADHFVEYLWRGGRLTEAEYGRALSLPDAPMVAPFEEALRPSHHPDLNVEVDLVLLGTVGRGGMADVYAARDLVLGRKVAYKVLGARATTSAGAARRFVNEAQLTAQLEHPAIIPIYSLRSPAPGELAYTMKLVKGDTLAKIVDDARARHARGEPVDEPQERANRLEILLRVAEATSFAHARGVIHRDLKPANVMIGAHGEVYVMDWGIAQVFASRSHPEDDPFATQVGQAIGTPAYMAPEQARGERDDLGPATDQYALGLILQEIVTLQPALRGGSAERVLHSASNARREPLRHVAPQVPIPADLAAIIERATAPEPAHRYRDVDAFIHDVRLFLRGRETSVLPDSRLGRVSRWLADHRMFATAWVFGILLLFGTLAGAAIVLSLGSAVTAQRREIAVADAVVRSERLANDVDAELVGYGRLVEAVSAATTIVVAHTEPSDIKIYLGPDFADRATAPADLRVRADGRAVSLDSPAFWLPPGRGHDDPMVRRIVRLTEDLHRMLLRSALTGSLAVTEAEEWELLGVAGVPAAEISVALDGGLRLVYPGTADVTGDPRIERWYQVAAGRRFLHWDRPRRVDGSVRVHCSRSVFADGEKEFVGVVDIDFVMGRSILEVLAANDAWLLDPEGRVIASPTGPGGLEPYAHPDLLAIASPDESRLLEKEEGMAVISPVRSLGWYLVSHP